MNEVLSTIAGRRSVRAFTNQEVTAEDLRAILDTAVLAPSGMNLQVWKFVALKGRKRIDPLVKVAKAAYANSGDPRLVAMGSREGFDPFYGAPVVIIASADQSSYIGAYDCACGLQNMMLAAQSLGLGTCWVHSPARIGDSAEAKALRAEYGIPESHVIHGSIALGYPAGPSPKMPERKPGAVTVLD